MQIKADLKANRDPGAGMDGPNFKSFFEASGPYVSAQDESNFNDYVLGLDELYEALSVGNIFQAITDQNRKKYAIAEELYNNIKTNKNTVKVGITGKTYLDALKTSDDIADPAEQIAIDQNKKMIKGIYDLISISLPSSILADGGDQQNFNDERHRKYIFNTTDWKFNTQED